MDTFSKKKRSQIMSAVKSKGNKATELALLTLLKTNKIKGWRRQYVIVGTPDFAWPKKKLAVFVDGCFWHGCPHCYKPPKSNVKFWKTKVRNNVVRDRRINRLLRKKGWKVLRIWQCKIIDKRTLSRIQDALKTRK